jgi:hypothetical protein
MYTSMGRISDGKFEKQTLIKVYMWKGGIHFRAMETETYS